MAQVLPPLTGRDKSIRTDDRTKRCNYVDLRSGETQRELCPFQTHVLYYRDSYYHVIIAHLVHVINYYYSIFFVILQNLLSSVTVVTILIIYYGL